MSDKVEAGQVWYDRKTGDQRIVCDVGDSIVHWRTPTGKRRGVGKYLPHWLQDMSPTPIEPKLPSPTDAVIAAARELLSWWDSNVPVGGAQDAAQSSVAAMKKIRTAITALDAAKGSTQP